MGAERWRWQKGKSNRELQRVVHLEQAMEVIAQEDHAAAPHPVEPLRPAQHAEDDLVDGRARPQEQPGLGGPERHLHQSAPFGHEA